jgi:hypothetical protein
MLPLDPLHPLRRRCMRLKGLLPRLLDLLDLLRRQYGLLKRIFMDMK